MNTRLLKYWVLLLLLSVGFNVRAQYYPRLYGLAVKQQFTPWGDCGNDPYFVSAVVRVGHGQKFVEEKAINSLNSLVDFDKNYVNVSTTDKVILCDYEHSNDTVSFVAVKTSAGGILNDHYLTYDLATLNAGINTYSREASDPCSNSANWGGKREGYIMTTTVYVDDPVDLYCDDLNRSYSAEEGTLTLKTRDFFKNGKNEYELQVALDNGKEEWTKIPATVFIEPNSSYVLTYEDIAGKKINEPNYFKWMGRSLKFRVVKTLVNGSKSVGKIVAGVRFFPRGLQFRVIQTERSYCNPNVTISVQLENSHDNGYFNLDSFEWVTVAFINGERKDRYYCKMQATNNPLIFILDIKGNNNIDPFNESNILPIEWMLQLQEKSNTNNTACVKSFTIPPKPDKIAIEQIGKDKYTIFNKTTNSDLTYDVPDYNHPYAMLKIEDNFFYQRYPYVIVDSAAYAQNPKSKNVLATINELPPSTLTADQEGEFEDHFSKSVLDWSNGAYKTYFQQKYMEWANAQTKDNVLYPSGEYRFYPSSYHSHMHTHTCQHSHVHTHFCREITPPDPGTGDPGKYSCYDDHQLCNVDPHNLCNSNDTHCPSDHDGQRGILQSDEHMHEHSASHDHPHTHNDGIHNYHNSIPAYNNPLFNHTVIKRYTVASNTETNFSSVYDGTSEVALIATGYNMRYTIKVNGTAMPDIELWNENYIKNSIYPDKGIAKKWFDDYKKMYKDIWASQKIGIKVDKGILVNQPKKQTLLLIDKAGCPYYFKVSVKAPPEAYFVISNKVPPSSACANDGKVKITYMGGGAAPYSHSAGSMSEIGSSITVEGLHYNLNQIQLSDGESKPSITIDVNIPSPNSATPTPQTCSTPNGKVTISVPYMTGIKTYTLTSCSQPSKIQENTTSENTYTFTEKIADTYDVLVDNGTCTYSEKGVVVASQVFGLAKPIAHTDALRLGDLGGVSIEFENNSNSVTWDKSTAPQVFNPSDNTSIVNYTGVTPGVYKTTASHTAYGETCTIPVDFEVKTPQFRASIDLKMENGIGSLEAWLSSPNELVLPYQLKLVKHEGGLDVPVPNAVGSTLIKGNLPDGSYTVRLVYGGANYVQDLYSFDYPLDTIKSGYRITTPIKCFGGKGGIKLTPSEGIAGGIIEASTNGMQFSSTMDYVVDSSFTYSLRSKKTSTLSYWGSSVAINESVVKNYTLKIPSPKVVSARVVSIDVSCSGKEDGSISLTEFKGGSGQYQYKVNNDNWLNSTDVVTRLLPGEYSIYLKDKGNDCPFVYLTTSKISQPAPLAIENLNVIQPICEKENGSISAEVHGGNGFYKHYWLYNNKDTLTKNKTFIADTIYGLGSKLKYGRYDLSVQDINGCSLSQSVDLIQYHNPSVLSAQPTPARCFGDANGEISVLTTGGTSPIGKIYLKNSDNSYSDSIQKIGDKFMNLKSGIYNLTVKDELGCRTNAASVYTAEVTQPATPISIVLDQVNPVIGKQTSTGSISATVLGGNPGLKEVKLIDSKGFCVNTSNQLENFLFALNSLPADKYSITATDVKGCSFLLQNVEVLEPQLPLSFTLKEKKDALCKTQTGFIEVQAKGGWGGYEYKREGYSTFLGSPRFENLNAGNYRITVKDRLGATFTDSIAIFEPKDSLRSWVSNLKNPTCSDNGEISLRFDGGTAPYQVFDSTNRVTYPFTSAKDFAVKGLKTNNYIMRITDSNGCLYDVDAELDKSQLLKVSFVNPEYPSAVGSSDGAINAEVQGGIKPYTFQWKKSFGNALSEITPSLKGIPAGRYELTVAEGGGCSVTSSFYLPGIDEYPFKLAEIGNETSFGAKNGYAKLTSPFSSWKEFDIIKPDNSKLHLNSGESNTMFDCQGYTVNLKNLEGGTYFISGTTSENNRVYKEVTIEPYIPFVVKNVVKDVDRIGDTNGQITLTVEGGGGNNTFTWSQISGTLSNALKPQNDANGSVLSNIPAGEYSYSITDGYGNTISDNVKVLEPDAPLKISIVTHKNETCKDSTNAYVELEASGGWGKYQFKDDRGKFYANNKLYMNLDVRNHEFYAVDKRGVVESIQVQITEPDRLRSRVSFIDSVNCKGAGDGSVDFLVEGGTPPYRLANTDKPKDWLNGTTARNLAKGEYLFTFTDAQDCPVQSSVPVAMPEPDSLLSSKIDVTHTTCNTDNGKISVDLKGGTKPYKYQWLNSNNQTIGTTNSLQSLSQNGYYRLKVVDKNSCAQNLAKRINPSVNPTITDIDTTAVLCYGGNTGTATIRAVKSGTPYAPYTFKWPNGDGETTSKGYRKGIYSVVVTDTNKCSTASYFEITQPDSLRISITDRKNAHCFGYNDAFIQAKGLGGVGDYTYKWSTGATTNRIENLYKGEYQLSVKDANQCETVESFSITQPDKLEVDLGADIKMCPGNSRVIDGQEFASHTWSNGTGEISKERYLTVREASDYFLKVTNSIGCFAWDTINLSIGNDALKSDFLLSSQAEQGDTLTLIELSNMVTDSLNWSYNKNAFAEVENKTGLDYMLFLKSNQTGIYNIELSAYSGGCISTVTKQIEIIADSGGNPDDDDLGYKDPLIKSFSVNPNPTDGNFYAEIKLRDVSSINLVLFSVASGVKIEERFGHNQKDYSVGYNLSNLNSGIYLLILKAGNERKQVKIIIQ